MIKEIFGPTIQGEGIYSGRVVSFLRFAGCNRWSGLESDRAKSICAFCDTDFRGGVKMTSDDILLRLEKIKTRNVVISGGEPTLQLDSSLVEKLISSGFKVSLETNGSRAIDYGHLIYVAMSPKQTRAETKLLCADEVKILLPEIAPGVSPEEFSSFPAKIKYVQPQWGTDLSQVIQRLYSLDGWRISLQTHKYLGVL